MTLTILSGKLARLNADTRSLSLHIHFSNNGTRSFYRTYYSNLRLVIDGVLHAPTDAPIAQVDTSSAGEFDYRFDVPITASRAVLRIIHDDQTAEIPLDFTTTKPGSQGHVASEPRRGRAWPSVPERLRRTLHRIGRAIGSDIDDG